MKSETRSPLARLFENFRPSLLPAEYRRRTNIFEDILFRKHGIKKGSSALFFFLQEHSVGDFVDQNLQRDLSMGIFVDIVSFALNRKYSHFPLEEGENFVKENLAHYKTEDRDAWFQIVDKAIVWVREQVEEIEGNSGSNDTQTSLRYNSTMRPSEDEGVDLVKADASAKHYLKKLVSDYHFDPNSALDYQMIEKQPELIQHPVKFTEALRYLVLYFLALGDSKYIVKKNFKYWHDKHFDVENGTWKFWEQSLEDAFQWIKQNSH